MNVWRDLKTLEQGWDSYGAVPVSVEVLKACKYLYEFFEVKPHVIPVPDGGIVFVWRTDYNSIEWEITPDGPEDLVFSARTALDSTYSDYSITTIDDVNELINKIMPKRN